MFKTVPRPPSTSPSPWPCPISMTRSDRILDHERLDAFRVAEELDRVVVEILRRAPRGLAWFADQAQRASGSAGLNLVEALGRTGADRARFLRTATGSALELDAALGYIERRGGCDAAARRRARELAVRLVSMLTRLAAVATG